MSLDLQEILDGTVEAWARDRPDAVALVEGERALTFGEWNAAADRVASGLAAHGLGEGDVVVLRTQIRLEWAVLALAVAKLGGRVLALNWRLTAPEARFVLSNAGAAALVCDDPEPAPLREVCEALGLRLAVSLDAPAEGFVPYAELAAAEPGARVSRGEPPLILYTSGTSGLPKGVEMRAAQLARTDPRVAEYLADVQARNRATPGSVTLLTMPLHHGAGVSQLWSTARRGDKLVMLRRYDPAATLALIAAHRVTHWTGVPTMYKRIAALPPAEIARHDLSSLQRIGIGAAPSTPALKARIDEIFGPGRLTEGYGSTESGMISGLDAGGHVEKPGSSGRPFRHVEIRIRDADGADLPPGEVGEIWARTPVAIEAYLGAPPLGPGERDAEGFMRLGDAGRLDEDGHLFITDRVKDMIVSGGGNIYPAEIEAALIQHPRVQDVAVIGIPHEEFGEQVKAFVEPVPGARLEAAELADFAAARLASYKRPRSIDIVDELPRNTMGKLLKRTLREPYWDGQGRRI